MKRQEGFTLIELLIVVAMIVIIAAISIPSLVTSKISANEASAVASIRAIQTAEVTYQTTYPAQGYASSLAALGGSEPCTSSATTACLLDESLAGGTKSGYNLAAVGGDSVGGANTTFVAGAAPAAFQHTGVQRFCATERSVIRRDPNSGGNTVPPDAQQCVGFRAM